MRNRTIPLAVKKECCRLYDSGKSLKEIYYEFYIKEVAEPCVYEAFKRAIYKWRKKGFPDDTTLNAGTYQGFVAHGATVQVSKDGEIIQAWIKQTATDISSEELVTALRDNVEHYQYHKSVIEDADRMLEIPLFDMHWGISFFDDYENVLYDIITLIRSKHWDRIIIPFGQDFFHNDSVVNNTTTKGTVIEKVDMLRAIKEGREFIVTIIDEALNNSNEVKVLYSPGNHDRSISWMFMQVLVERYGEEVVDDSMEYRKVFSYGKNAIMVTHGDSKQATANNLAHIFAISFPKKYANATTREVHSGHLHHEKEGDIFGVMVRRLSSKVAVDDWSNRQDFVGVHRRFMLFEWDKNSLKSIHYV